MRPEGKARERARDVFVAAFPQKESDEYWPGNSYFLVRPRWLRFSSYYRPRWMEEYVLGTPDEKPQTLCARLKARFQAGHRSG